MTKSTPKGLFVAFGSILLLVKIFEIFTEPNFGFSESDNAANMGNQITGTIIWAALGIGLLCNIIY